MLYTSLKMADLHIMGCLEVRPTFTSTSRILARTLFAEVPSLSYYLSNTTFILKKIKLSTPWIPPSSKAYNQA
jgi:hypothetical protein